MNLFTALFALAKTVLDVYLKNTSYEQQILDLEKQYHEELSKPDDLRNDAVLVNLQRELCELTSAITSAARRAAV